MTPRMELAHELEVSCPPGDHKDLAAIAAALARGESKGTILFMPEVFRWPDTYHWLREKLL